MIRSTTAVAAALLCATPALAGLANSASYGWEDGGTILGGYNNDGMFYENSSSEAYGGTQSLFLQEVDLGGTPQTFVAHITGLTDGDTVFGSFMAWDDSFGASSSLRIWGSYTSGGDITAYSGSAGGNSTYSGAEGGDLWQELSHTWTFDSDGGERDGLVIQIRMYANSGGDPGLYVDDLYVETSSETAVINVAPAPGALALLGLAGIAGRRRRA
jgi:hypothetical protein